MRGFCHRKPRGAALARTVMRLAALYRSGQRWVTRPACMADGRTALSQHRRRAQARRRGRRRISFLLVTTLTALVAIAAGVLVAIVRADSGTDPAAAALAEIPTSHTAALLEQERQQMILVDAASKTLSMVGTPKLATRPPSSGGSAVALSFPPPDPGTAEAIAFNMLPSFGFNANTQYPCLNDIWTRESGWRYNAENASGAYGIPQALPGSKMASAGSDWETDPTTQIKWGLGYIQGRYGTPCAAWTFWQANGWY
jgi:hypothetical protein